MIGCWSSLCLVMMLWTVRARLSVPPPGPAVATNSIDLVGFHSACAGVPAPTPHRTMAPTATVAVRFLARAIFSSPEFASVLGRRIRALPTAGLSRHDRAFAFKSRDLVLREAEPGEDLARVLAVE